MVQHKTTVQFEKADKYNIWCNGYQVITKNLKMPECPEIYTKAMFIFFFFFQNNTSKICST